MGVLTAVWGVRGSSCEQEFVRYPPFGFVALTHGYVRQFFMADLAINYETNVQRLLMTVKSINISFAEYALNGAIRRFFLQVYPVDLLVFLASLGLIDSFGFG